MVKLNVATITVPQEKGEKTMGVNNPDLTGGSGGLLCLFGILLAGECPPLGMTMFMVGIVLIFSCFLVD